MKRIYTPLLLLLTGFIANAQVTFQSGYGDTIYDEGRTLLTSASGNYVVLGTSGSNLPNLADPTIFFLDNLGSVIYTYHVGSFGDEFAGGMVQTDDEGFIIVGTTHVSSIDTTNTDLFAVKISNLGGFVHWSKVYGGAGIEKAHSIFRTPDGNFIILGSTTSLGSATQSALALKINEDGDQVWCNVNNTTTNNFFNCGTVTPERDYILAGGCFQSDTDNYVVRMDSMGTILWSKRYGSTASEYINDIKIISDSGYITVGNKSSQPTGGNIDQCLMRFKSTGVPVWSYTFGKTLTDEAFSMLTVSDDRFLVCGYSAEIYGSGISNQMVISEIDTSGNLQWTKIIGDTAIRSEGYDIVAGLDGGFAASGLTLAFSDPAGDIFMVKTDSILNSGCFEFPYTLVRDTAVFTDSSGSIDQLVLLNEAEDSLYLTPYFNQNTENCFFDWISYVNADFQLKLFPNPSNRILNFDSENEISEITIYDYLGRKLFFQKTAGRQFSLDVSNLSTGIHFIEAKSVNNLVRKKFIKE